MNNFMNDIIIPAIKENKLTFILGVLVVVLSLILIFNNKGSDWEDVNLKNVSTLWTTTRADGSKTQFIMIIQKNKKNGKYRSFKLDGENK